MTDPDSRAMAAHPRVAVGYNAQIAVDVKHKLIVEQQVTNQVVDMGQLTQTAEPAKEIAVTALHAKGLDVGDAELRADFIKRIHWTLTRMLRRGAVTKEGFGMSARWGLPLQQESENASENKERS